MGAKGGYVYIVSNAKRTVLYIGVTSDLASRIYEHKNAMGSIFTKKYRCFDLLFYEFFDYIESAILREKQMKKWKRKWKDELIFEFNPQKRDLYKDILDFH